MIIEFSNTIEAKSHSAVAMAIVVSACALFFIPTTLIILGYYSSQPTGSLVSPLPQGTLSQQTITPTPSPITITPTPTPEVNNQPIIAAPNESTSSAASDISSAANSNIIDKTATIEAGQTEATITDVDITENSQIYLSPRPGDKALYSLRSKKAGSFIIAVGSASDTVRYIDYHIANP